eukprot:gene6498-biopygen22381
MKISVAPGQVKKNNVFDTRRGPKCTHHSDRVLRVTDSDGFSRFARERGAHRVEQAARDAEAVPSAMDASIAPNAGALWCAGGQAARTEGGGGGGGVRFPHLPRGSFVRPLPEPTRIICVLGASARGGSHRGAEARSRGVVCSRSQRHP